MTRRRDRERRPPRRAPSLEPKRRLLVVCEGKVTEPQYIEGYKRMVNNPAVAVSVARERGDPKKVVEIARHLKESAAEGDFDEVWCVFDRDEHERFHEAIQMARDNGFKLAVSNPCVELWLLLHFQESPGARHRDDVARLLRKHVPGYDKRLDFGRFAPHVQDASKRAERLDREAAARGDGPFENPSTGFYKLTEAIARQ